MTIHPRPTMTMVVRTCKHHQTAFMAAAYRVCSGCPRGWQNWARTKVGTATSVGNPRDATEGEETRSSHVLLPVSILASTDDRHRAVVGQDHHGRLMRVLHRMPGRRYRWTLADAVGQVSSPCALEMIFIIWLTCL